MFFPTVMFDNISVITLDYLKQNNIKALILDVDNTLTGHGSQQLEPHIKNWVEEMRNAGIKLVISSNNFKKRVMPFAEQVGMPFIAFSLKPSPHGLARARKLVNVSKNEIALVGDQVFTDVIGANIYGIKSFLVKPMYNDTSSTIVLKRKLEAPIIRNYFKKGGKLYE